MHKSRVIRNENKTVYMCLCNHGTGCGSAQRKVNKSEAAINKKSLSLIEDYEKCLKKAGDDLVKAEPCERYRKAAEALK